MALDWKIPVSAVCGAAFTVAVMVWQAGHRDAVIDDHTARIMKLEATVDAQGKSFEQVKETLARIDERLRFLIEQFGYRPSPVPTHGAHP